MDWLLNGLLAGAVYALVALGLSLVLGIMKVVNLAHGSFYALGAYLTYSLNARWQLQPLQAVPFVMAVTFVLGMALEASLVRPVRLHSTTVAVLTLSTGIVLEQVMLLVWGPFYLSLPGVFPQVATAGVAAGLIGAILLFLRTMNGLAVRLVAEDEEQATVVGIDVGRVHSIIFGLSCSLAAAGGALTAPLRAIYPTMGRAPMIISLAIVILGGMGNIEGSLYAGALFGLASYLIGLHLGPQWAYVGALSLLVLALLAKPSGLLGRVVFRD